MAGCTSSTPVNLNNIYNGYPCGNNCDSFKQGYEDAKLQQFTLPEQCDKVDQSRKIGCLSYIQEYSYEHSSKAVSFDSDGRQTN